MRLLIVEDSKEIIDSLKLSLKAEGFIVDTALDGETGSYMARTNSYDLIILDNILPKKDGYEVCCDIRKEGNNVPIISLSIKSDVDIKVKLLNAGVDDYISKPFSFAELLARIKVLLRRPSKIEQSILKIDGMTIDLDGHTVMCCQKEIKLTPKEFALLEYLVKNRGRVLSRGIIMEHVWDSETDPFSNTIETHILNLRRKVRQLCKKDFIHTIPGVGYKVV
jgi:DNA-binding response OmpR family regulator